MCRIVLVFLAVLLSSACAWSQEIRSTYFAVQQPTAEEREATLQNFLKNFPGTDVPENISDNWPTWLVFLPDSVSLVTACRNGEIEVRNIGDGKLVTMVERQGYSSGVKGLALSPDGKYLAAPCSYPSVVALWRTDTWQQVAGNGSTAPSGARYIGFLSVGTKTEVVVYTMPGLGLKLYDLESLLSGKEEVREPRLTLGGSGFAISPADKTIVLAGKKGIHRIYSNLKVDTLVYKKRSGRWPAAPSFSVDGSLLALDMMDGTVQLFTAKEALPNGKLPVRMQYISRLSLSPNGKQLAVCGYKKWDWVKTKGLANSFHSEFESPVLSLFTQRPDGTYVPQELHGHQGGINDLAYSPDGRYLASSSTDGTVRIWSVGGNDSLAANRR